MHLRRKPREHGWRRDYSSATPVPRVSCVCISNKFSSTQCNIYFLYITWEDVSTWAQVYFECRDANLEFLLWQAVRGISSMLFFRLAPLLLWSQQEMFNVHYDRRKTLDGESNTYFFGVQIGYILLYTHIHVHIHACIYIHTHTYVCICIYKYVYMVSYVHTYTYILCIYRIYIRIYTIYIYIHIHYIYIYIFVYIHIHYIYIYTYTLYIYIYTDTYTHTSFLHFYIYIYICIHKSNIVTPRLPNNTDTAAGNCTFLIGILLSWIGHCPQLC